MRMQTLARKDCTVRAHSELVGVILPFWLAEGADPIHGGIHTCFDNRGEELLATDKYVWSQGRWAWMTAHAARLTKRGLLDLDAEVLLRHATTTMHFLESHALVRDGTCHFVLTTDGRALDEPHSVYADLFVAMGAAEVAAATGDKRWLNVSRPILERAEHDIHAGAADTPPYPVPDGHRALGPEMILLNALVVDAQARRDLGIGYDSAALATALDRTLAHREPGGTFVEMRPESEALAQGLVARHRVPGHDLEAVWIGIEAAELLGREDAVETLIHSAAPICELGWDPEHGGLLRYVDIDGLRPTGALFGHPYETMVLDTWDTKLWWVHTEAAYATALAAHLGSDDARAWAERIWDYTLETFPGGREWIQIRDRSGAPLDKTVALPVKDPFHIARALMQLIALSAGRP